jgi:hypothetical protein
VREAVAAKQAVQGSAVLVASVEGLAPAALTALETPADVGLRTILAALTARADQEAVSEREGPADRMDLEDLGDPEDPEGLEDPEDLEDRMVHSDSGDRAQLVVGAARGVGRHPAVAPFLAPPSRSSRTCRASLFLATTGRLRCLRQEEPQGQG